MKILCYKIYIDLVEKSAKDLSYSLLETKNEL